VPQSPDIVDAVRFQPRINSRKARRSRKAQVLHGAMALRVTPGSSPRISKKRGGRHAHYKKYGAPAHRGVAAIAGPVPRPGGTFLAGRAAYRSTLDIEVDRCLPVVVQSGEVNERRAGLRHERTAQVSRMSFPPFRESGATPLRAPSYVPTGPGGVPPPCCAKDPMTDRRKPICRGDVFHEPAL